MQSQFHYHRSFVFLASCNQVIQTDIIHFILTLQAKDLAMFRGIKFAPFVQPEKNFDEIQKNTLLKEFNYLMSDREQNPNIGVIGVIGDHSWFPLYHYSTQQGPLGIHLLKEDYPNVEDEVIIKVNNKKT